MKSLIIIFLSFYQIDMAIAQDTLSSHILKHRMISMTKLAHPTPLPIELNTISPEPETDVLSPMSCDLNLNPSLKDIKWTYNCDATKTFEHIKIAQN